MDNKELYQALTIVKGELAKKEIEYEALRQKYIDLLMDYVDLKLEQVRKDIKKIEKRYKHERTC